MRIIATTSAVGLIAGACVLTGSVSAIAEPVDAATARQQVSDQTADPLTVHRKSSKCNSPAGKKFNVSWGEGGQSTTFYFNNHCNKKRRIVVRNNYGSHPVVACIVVNPHTSGRKKIGVPTYILQVGLPKSKCP